MFFSPQIDNKTTALILSILSLFLSITVLSFSNSDSRKPNRERGDNICDLLVLKAEYEKIKIAPVRYFDGELRFTVGYFDSGKTDFTKDSRYEKVFEILRKFYFSNNNYKDYYLSFDGHADEVPYNTNLNLSIQRAQRTADIFNSNIPNGIYSKKHIIIRGFGDILSTMKKKNDRINRRVDVSIGPNWRII